MPINCVLLFVCSCHADPCRLSKDAGPCFERVLRFYWSSDDAECRPFTYGGCGGNNNKFHTADECYDRCAVTADDGHQRRTYSPADCFKPRVEGHCDRAEVRWFFDSTQRDCLAFYYTGCGSNGNNFRDYEDCYAFCSSGTCSLAHRMRGQLVSWQHLCILPKRLNRSGCHLLQTLISPY